MTNFEELSRFIGFTPKFLGIIPSFPEFYESDYSAKISKILIERNILIEQNENNNPYNIDPYKFEECLYTVNKDLIDEMYRWYESRMLHNGGPHGYLYTIHEISLKIDQCLDYDEKILKLKKHYKKHAKGLQGELLSSNYLFEDSSLEIDKEKFINFIKQCFGEDINLILTYLSKKVPDLNGIGVPYEDDTSDETNNFVLNSWAHILGHDLVLNFIRKEIENLKSNRSLNKVNIRPAELTLSQSLILLDRIRNIPADTWDNIDYIKRARIIGKLINRSSENIRKKLPLFDKQNSSLPNQFLSDQDFIDLFLKDIIS